MDSGQPEVRLACDMVLVAIGQGIESKNFEKYGIPVKRGVIDALNWSGVKDISGVFAGGDCVTGPATVIRAIAAGKVAAANIDEFLGYHHVISTDVQIPKVRMGHQGRAAPGSNMKERSGLRAREGFPADRMRHDRGRGHAGIPPLPALRPASASDHLKEGEWSNGKAYDRRNGTSGKRRNDDPGRGFTGGYPHSDPLLSEKSE